MGFLVNKNPDPALQQKQDLLQALGDVLRIHYALNKGNKSTEILRAKKIHEKYINK